MGEKYLQSKSGSLEDLATQIASKKSDVKVENNLKLTKPKTYFQTKEGSLGDVAARIVTEGLDPVNKDAVKKDFKKRQDKDIDNDGDVDSTDKYLHTRRQAISKATKSETHTFTAQPFNKKQKDTKGEKEIIKPIKEVKNEELQEKTYGWTLVSKAKDLAKKFANNMTKAVAEIEKLEKGLSDNPAVSKELLKYNEEVEIKEAMSDAQLKKIRDQYKEIKTISPEKVKTLRNFLDKYSTDTLMQLAQANINFVSTMARSVMNKRKMGDPKHAGSSKTGSIGEKNEKKTYSNLRAEVDNGKKTMTGQKPAVINTEPKTTHI